MSHLLIHVCVLILTIRLIGLVKRVDLNVPVAPMQAQQVKRRAVPSVPNVETLPSPKTVYRLKLPDQADSLTPYNLVNLINGVDKGADGFFDLTAVWGRLGIGRDRHGDFDGIDPSGPWTAQVLQVGKPNNGNLVIVFISAWNGGSRRYLIFRWESARWQVSNIDILDSKYPGSPHQQYHRLVTHGQSTWLALRRLGESGTGVYEVDEDWYEISGTRAEKVLELPTKGWFNNDNEDICNREFGSRMIGEKTLRGSYAIQVRFWVTFGQGKEDWKFRQTKDATYVWNEWERQFVLDDSSSDISQDEIADVFHTGMLTDSKFLIYNLPELARIRERGSQRDRTGLDSLFGRMRSRE